MFASRPTGDHDIDDNDDHHQMIIIMTDSLDWIDAIADFFTVVEFPVLGYLPPAVLTELHFQVG